MFENIKSASIVDKDPEVYTYPFKIALELFQREGLKEDLDAQVLEVVRLHFSVILKPVVLTSNSLTFS